MRVQKSVPGRYPRGIASFGLELAPEGSLNEAMRFYDEPGRNQSAWANLPRYYWTAAVEKPAPGATTLVYNPIATAFGKMPLIAHHYAGQGRVLFVGTDETFRWRQNVGERFFARFWGQAVRFVARRDEAGSRKSRLEVRPYRTPPGEPVEVELMAFKPDGAAVTSAEMMLPLPSRTHAWSSSCAPSERRTAPPQPSSQAATSGVPVRSSTGGTVSN